MNKDLAGYWIRNKNEAEELVRGARKEASDAIRKLTNCVFLRDSWDARLRADGVLVGSEPKKKMGLWRKGGMLGCKYLLLRRDGSKPKSPFFAILASDPCAPAALRAYADEAERLGLHADYVRDMRELHAEFIKYASENPPGDPDASPHRRDDPDIIARMMEPGT